MTNPVAGRLEPGASSSGHAARFDRFMLFCMASVPYGIARALFDEPLRTRPTEPDETFWIVPEINFGPPQLSTLP